MEINKKSKIASTYENCMVEKLLLLPDRHQESVQKLVEF